MMHLHEEVEGGVKWNMLKFLGKNLQFLPNEEKRETKQTKNKNKHIRNMYLWFETQTFLEMQVTLMC